MTSPAALTETEPPWAVVAEPTAKLVGLFVAWPAMLKVSPVPL